MCSGGLYNRFGHSVDITESVNLPNWNRFAPGPGVGIQLRNGRLVIPCYHRVVEELVHAESVGDAAHNHVIYSDDHGKTWHRGESTEARIDESQIVELSDGSLMLKIRSNRGKGRRAISISQDGGVTWSKPTDDPTLVEPVCQASFIRYTDSREFMKNRLLFSNPAKTVRK